MGFGRELVVIATEWEVSVAVVTPAVPLWSSYLGLTFDISVSGKSSFPA